MDIPYEICVEAYERLRQKYPTRVLLLTSAQFGNVFWRNHKKVSLLYAMAIAECLGEEVEDILVPPDHVLANRYLRAAQAVEVNDPQPVYDVEGKPIPRYGTRYERKPKLRIQAIQSHGTTCQGCGFNFEQWYGKRGRGYIEVHHKRPLSEGEQKVDPKEDLIVLCANCHAMVHADRRHVLTLESTIP